MKRMAKSSPRRPLVFGPSRRAECIPPLVVALTLLIVGGCQQARSDRATLPPLPSRTAGAGASAGPTVPAVTGPTARAAAPPTAAGTAQPLADQAAALKLTGTAAAHRQSLVSVSGMGLIQKLFVREGDVVKKGQVLCQLDSTGSSLQLRQAKAALALAQVQRAAAEREHGRLGRLKQESAIAGMQLDQASTGLDAAGAAVAQASALVALATKAVADSTVRAPFAGLVVQKLMSEGEWVSTMPPAPIIMLAEIDPLDVRIQAPEHLLPLIHRGDPVAVHFAAIGKTLPATVTRVVPLVMPPTRSFTVIVELPNPDGALQPGLFAEVQIRPGARPAGAAADRGAVTDTGDEP